MIKRLNIVVDMLRGAWLYVLVGFFFGSFYGVNVQSDKFYKDCRFAGAVRIGEAAFKCDQYSKVVLLTPDEQYEKSKENDRKTTKK